MCLRKNESYTEGAGCGLEVGVSRYRQCKREDLRPTMAVAVENTCGRERVGATGKDEGEEGEE